MNDFFTEQFVQVITDIINELSATQIRDGSPIKRKPLNNGDKISAGTYDNATKESFAVI